jgi:hypothetical protein
MGYASNDVVPIPCPADIPLLIEIHLCSPNSEAVSCSAFSSEKLQAPLLPGYVSRHRSKWSAPISAVPKHSDASELQKLAEAKEQVAARMEKLENAVVAAEEEIARLRKQFAEGPISV